jgi:uncharacterized protein
MKRLFNLLIISALAFSLHAQKLVSDSVFIRKNYVKREVSIPMRDGIKLFTSIYTPKDKKKKIPDYAVSDALHGAALWQG